MKRIILIISSCLIALATVGAQVKVKGKVTDATDTEAMGVIVSVKGTAIGTVTDANGNYELEVPDKNAVLVFMFPGSEKIEKQCISGTLNVKLEGDVNLQKIVLFDKYGTKVFEKENVKISSGNLSFLHFMTEEEYEKLKPDTYLFLISKGEYQETGFIKKTENNEEKLDKYEKKTPYSLKIREHNLCKNKKIYLEIDNEKTLVTQDTVLYDAEIKFKKNKLSIEGPITYKEKASLHIGKKEIALDGRRSAGDKLFIMNVFRDNGKEEMYIEDNSFDNNKDKNTIVFQNKNEAPVLYVIDGVIQKQKKAWEELSPDSIEEINVIKGEMATAIYGERGENGVIIITTKNKTISNTPLVVLDGVPLPLNYDIKQLSADAIESISVLKDKAAVSLYGERGKNGVIIITTKGK